MIVIVVSNERLHVNCVCILSGPIHQLTHSLSQPELCNSKEPKWKRKTTTEEEQSSRKLSSLRWIWLWLAYFHYFPQFSIQLFFSSLRYPLIEFNSIFDILFSVFHNFWYYYIFQWVYLASLDRQWVCGTNCNFVGYFYVIRLFFSFKKESLNERGWIVNAWNLIRMRIFSKHVHCAHLMKGKNNNLFFLPVYVDRTGWT